MLTRGARAFAALSLLLLASSSFLAFADASSSSPAASHRHFVVDARDVLVSFHAVLLLPSNGDCEIRAVFARHLAFEELRSSASSSLSHYVIVCPKTHNLKPPRSSFPETQADPKAAFLSWAAHVSRPVMLLPSASSSSLKENNGLSTEEASPRDCSRRWSPNDRARFDAWTRGVLPRARRAVEQAFENESEKGGEEGFLELPLSSFASPPPLLPLEVNGIADLPLSTLRAGLLPAHLNAEASRGEEYEGFGSLDAIAAKLSEWLRFPYATEALLDAAASAADAATSAAAPGEEGLLSIALPSLSKHHRKRPLPASVDWSTKNVLGPVKNQHINGTPCGCCWAFATTGVVEGVVGVVSGKTPPSLSEQQLIDCDRGGPFDDLGCEGGSVEGKERESFEKREGENERKRGREKEEDEDERKSQKNSFFSSFKKQMFPLFQFQNRRCLLHHREPRPPRLRRGLPLLRDRQGRKRMPP